MKYQVGDAVEVLDFQYYGDKFKKGEKRYVVNIFMHGVMLQPKGEEHVYPNGLFFTHEMIRPHLKHLFEEDV